MIPRYSIYFIKLIPTLNINFLIKKKYLYLYTVEFLFNKKKNNKIKIKISYIISNIYILINIIYLIKNLEFSYIISCFKRFNKIRLRFFK